MKKEGLSTQPYKGARDFYPKDMRIRNYIFETWRKVCKSYGYEEFDGPFLEEFDLYASKTGEEIVKNQLYWFEDKSGRKIAIRPETTPTLARMVAKQFKTLARPIKWFTIQNMWRYEQPQRGRQREFFQLNFDILGVDGVEADFEILTIALELMKEFGAKEGMFEIRVGNRKLLDDFFTKIGLDQNQTKNAIKIIDKKSKMTVDEFSEKLKSKAKLDQNQVKKVSDLINSPNSALEKMLEQGSIGAQEVYNLLNLIKKSKNNEFVRLDPSIVRGFDYYTGNVFEQFDLNPKNNRSMYGGGRYDNLVEIFNGNKLPAVGLAIGDVTLQNFLEDWKLLPKFESETDYLVTLWPTEDKEKAEKFYSATIETANKLRAEGFKVVTWLEQNTKLDKQLKYADRKGTPNVVIIGDQEIKNKTVTIKDMKTGEQIEEKL